MTSHSPTQLQVEARVVRLDKNGNDLYHINVRPLEKNPVISTVENAISIKGIELIGDLPVGTPKQEITLEANYMAHKKSVVFIDRYPAKVVAWEAESGGIDPAQGADPKGHFTIIPHSRLPNGLHTMKFITLAGKIETPNAFQITGSDVGKPKSTTFKGRYGKDFVFIKPFKGNFPGGATVTNLSSDIIANGVKGKTLFTVTFTLPGNMPLGEHLFDESDLIVVLPNLSKSVTKGPIFNLTITTDHYYFSDLNLSVCHTATEMIGLFSGTATRHFSSTGTGPNSIEVTKGEFRISKPSPP